MPSGTVQVGLRLTAVIWVVSVGEGRSRLADDDGVAPHDLAVLDRLGDRGRDVHHHVALAEAEIHLGEPVERGRELAQPLRHRHVERGERALSDGAGLLEAVAGLEAPDRGGEIGVEDVAGWRARGRGRR